MSSLLSGSYFGTKYEKTEPISQSLFLDSEENLLNFSNGAAIKEEQSRRGAVSQTS